ncbi:MAG: nuclear transport factor 2 family protein [Gammaproteobacteria bacterium]
MLLKSLAKRLLADAGYMVVRLFEDRGTVFAHIHNETTVGVAVVPSHCPMKIRVQAKATHLNPSNRSMIDGPTRSSEMHRTKANKDLVNEFMKEVLVLGHFDKVANYFSPNGAYVQHNPNVGDGLAAFGQAVADMAANGLVMHYEHVEQVFGQGSFVLSISTGLFGPAPGTPTTFCDLFRVANGVIVEHWDVIAPLGATRATDA